tara:strand:- start:21944 stop:22171 length:228 start_codon:yes stop_codon:yes gene_type:complete
MKGIYILAATLMMMGGCGVQTQHANASAAQMKMMNTEKFKELTKDVDRNNPHEVKLAQALWTEMRKKQSKIKLEE